MLIIIDNFRIGELEHVNYFHVQSVYPPMSRTLLYNIDIQDSVRCTITQRKLHILNKNHFS